MVAVSLIAILFFGFPPSPLFFAATALVVYSMFLYGDLVPDDLAPGCSGGGGGGGGGGSSGGLGGGSGGLSPTSPSTAASHAALAGAGCGGNGGAGADEEAADAPVEAPLLGKAP